MELTRSSSNGAIVPNGIALDAIMDSLCNNNNMKRTGFHAEGMGLGYGRVAGCEIGRAHV